MNKSLSPNRLMLKLAKQGIPLTYAWRVTKELDDHASDLAENTNAKLGEPDRLVKEIVAGYRNRTFAGRHPRLTFTLLPLPLTVVSYLAFLFVWTAGVFLFGTAYSWISATPLNHDYLNTVMSMTLSLGTVVLPTMLLVWFVCRWARSAGLTWSQAAWACLPILLFAFIYRTTCFSSPIAGKSTIAFGIWLPLGDAVVPALRSGPFDWRQILQVVVPMMVMLGMIVREKSLWRSFVGPSLSADATHENPGELKEVA